MTFPIFFVSALIRILYEYPERIPAEIMKKIKSTLLNFRYWMDEPGENGMCYWSENHQILFASSEYLAGQLYPDSVFRNSGLTGKEHMDKAENRILDWLEMRWKFGFTEFYSNVYYSEDIGGMINLIDYAGNKEISLKTSVIMDLLVYDVASQKSGNLFLTVSGRAYEKNRKGNTNSSFNNITYYLWNHGISSKPHLNYGFITSRKYKAPSVLIEIGKDKNNTVIKQCNGLNLGELEAEGYFGIDERSIMMQWAMEAFSNPEIVRNTLGYIRKHNMFSNEFLAPIKYLDFTFIRWLHLEPLLTKTLNPQTNGVAIQKANTYTYRTKDYSLYTVQNYFPGNYADQVHVAGMTFANSFAVFHTHPALPDTVNFHSPNYWVGYGHLPHAVQDNNVSLSIYNIPENKSILEKDLLHFTHSYFPTEMFDSVVINENYAFGKKDSAYVALIGKNKLTLKSGSTDDLIQKGDKTFWIISAGSVEKDGSFEQFCEKILNSKIIFDENKMNLIYESAGKSYTLIFEGEFFVNGKVIETNYYRFDSPYIKAVRKPDTMEFRFNNKYLTLDFNKQKREYN